MPMTRTLWASLRRCSCPRRVRHERRLWTWYTSTHRSKYRSAAVICCSASASSDVHTFVATMARPRRPRSVRPSTRSAWPYMGEESKNVAPASNAASVTCARSSAAAPRTSNVCHVPMPTTGTSRPVDPNARCSIECRAGLTDQWRSRLADLEQQRKVIGCRGDVRRPDDLARSDVLRERARHERVVETHVGVRRRQRITDVVGGQLTERIDVTHGQHGGDRSPPDVPAAQPDERTQAPRQLARIEDVAWRHGVEVADEDVWTLSARGDAAQERAQLQQAAPLRPCRMPRAEVHAEHPPARRRRLDFQERVARNRGLAPCNGRHGLTAHERQRLAGARRPLVHAPVALDALDDIRPGRLFEHDDVRGDGTDHGGKRLLPARAAAPECVREDAKRHARLSMSVR